MPELVDELDLATEETYALLRGMSLAGVRNERAKGLGPPYVKLGREIYYRKSGLKELIEAKTVTPITAATLIHGRKHQKSALKREGRARASA